MNRDRRDPESIKKKKKRRSPEEMEELRRRRKRQEIIERSQGVRRNGNSKEIGEARRKRTPQEIEEIRRRKRAQEKRDAEIRRRNDALRYSQENEERERPIRKPIKMKKKKSVIGRIFKWLSLAILAFIIIGIIMVINFISNIKTDGIGGAVQPADGESVNILVLGMDIGDVSQVENESIKRTDTMMLVNYNPETKKTQIVSLPRDTLVKVKGKNNKMNALYQIGGNELVKETVEDMLDLTVNYIINLDYAAFRGFIDAIGGVDMYIEQDMIYDDSAQNLHINFKGGETVHLDGQKAEEFFRWRKNNDGTGLATGDLGRIENQHKFIQKVVDKCKSPSILLKAPKILDVVSENMKTNLSGKDMIKYGLDIMLSMKNGVNMTTITTVPEYIGGISYVLYDKNDNLELIDSLNSGSPVVKEPTKKDAKVMILNGSNKNGLASQVRTDLAAYGYEIVEVGNASETVNKSIVMTDYESLKEEIQELLPKVKKSEGKSTDSKYSDYDVVIILGTDYKR